MPGIIVNEAYAYEFHPSSGQTDTHFYTQLINLALEFSEIEINRKEIVSIKTKVEKNLVYDSTYFHTGKNKMTDVHFEIQTKNKYSKQETYLISVSLNQLINKTLNARYDRNKSFKWSFCMTVFSYFFSFIGNIILNSKFAGTAIVTAINGYFLFDLIRHQIKYKKMENILLTIVALEKGIQAAENAQKVLKNSSRPKKKD